MPAGFFIGKKGSGVDEHVLKNARRFTGFAGLYDGVRPRMPVYPVEVIRQYLDGNRTGSLISDAGRDFLLLSGGIGVWK